MIDETVAEEEGRAGPLRAAEERLHEAIRGLTQAFLGESAVERAEARDRFEEALADYTGLIDAE